MNSATQTARRTHPSTAQRLLLLAPPAYSGSFGTPPVNQLDGWNHGQLLSKVQRFRGATYLKDGAITKQSLDSEGRLRIAADLQSWNVVMMNGNGEVSGCSRYNSYRFAEDFEDLSVGQSALAQSDQWGPKLRAVVEEERRNALREDRNFVEVGGWAISEELRRTTEAIRIALATFALGQCLGGCIGVTTATLRHSSANLLRRIGGQGLSIGGVELPRYFDPQYECDMEILRFDSAAPNPKFAPWIDQLKMDMASFPVVTAEPNPWAKSHPKPAAASNFGMGLPQLAHNW